MDIQSITLGEVAVTCTLIMGLGAFVSWVLKPFTNRERRLRAVEDAIKSNADNLKLLTSLEERVIRLEQTSAENQQKLAVDYDRFSDLSRQLVILMHTNKDLLEHAIHGSNEDAMVERVKEIDDYLIKKGSQL